MNQGYVCFVEELMKIFEERGLIVCFQFNNFIGHHLIWANIPIGSSKPKRTTRGLSD
jgi:hypothetical protein